MNWNKIMNNNRRKEINKAIDLLTKIQADWQAALELIGTAADEEQEYFDNMPESLQSSDKGQGAESAAGMLTEVKDAMEEIDLDDFTSKLDDSTNQ